jgi:hypothetical protein
MKTPVLVGMWVSILLATAESSAEQHNKSPGPSAEKNIPRSIACAQERGESLGQCSYRVNRDEIDKTTVTVVFENGFKRSLFFQDGKFEKASVTMSGVGTDTEWSLEDGTHMIRVDGQRYEVPDSLIADN